MNFGNLSGNVTDGFIIFFAVNIVVLAIANLIGGIFTLGHSVSYYVFKIYIFELDDFRCF